MMEHLKSISLFIVLGSVVYGVSIWLQSDFLSEYLSSNLITVLLALLAINTTTSSVIMTKLREISDKTKIDFSRTIHSMKAAVLEQVTLIIVAVIALVLQESTLVTNTWAFSTHVFGAVLCAILAYAIHVLYDTANGVFIILQHENHDES